MTAAEIIRKKRSGEKLSQEEMEFLVKGYLLGTIPAYQMSAFLMAVYFRGMVFEETIQLTEIMLNSGTVVDLSSIPQIKVGKHSTGGVGDKTSLTLAPLAAACGVPVPMISGRGLEHTGGTLDKLESIPGFRTNLSLEKYKQIISEIGVVMIGQTEDLAPADGPVYALRDVTATVDSIPLIAASIMSKKLAEGNDALLLDVKSGCGAFMRTYEDALELAKTLTIIGHKFRKKTITFITDMNQPLGHAIGNWVEVVEAVECLRGKGPPDLVEMTTTFAGAMLALAGKAETIDEGIDKSMEVLSSGKAYDKFLELVSRQGGDAKYIENLEQHPHPNFSMEVHGKSDAYVEAIDALQIGLASVELGAGRKKMDDEIDANASVILKKKIGDPVRSGECIAILYADRSDGIVEAKRRVENAIRLGASRRDAPPLVISKVEVRDDIANEVSVTPWPGRNPTFWQNA